MPTTVTATDGEHTDSVEIENNYVLIVDGTAYRHGVTVHRHKDGTQSHVITVKGIKS
jgi:hypothetical protein